MNSPRISLVCPTRDRYDHIEQFVSFATLVDSSLIKITVSDNSTNEKISAETMRLCREAEIDYIRPVSPLPMVSHWEFALGALAGDYVGVLTDKMFPIASMLESVLEILEDTEPDIVTWSGNTFFPTDNSRNFEAGHYVRHIEENYVVDSFDPQEELLKRLSGVQNRKFMNQIEYGRGKICFGLYSQNLVNQIRTKYGRVFHHYTPDYSSLSIALGSAGSGIELNRPVIVQINMPDSTGNNVNRDDQSAFDYLIANTPSSSGFECLPIPNLYSSLNNVVLHEYLTFYKLNGLDFEIDWSQWLPQIVDDLYGQTRSWSSDAKKAEQEIILRSFIESPGCSLTSTDTANLLSTILQAPENQLSLANRVIAATRPYIPSSLLNFYRVKVYGRGNVLVDDFKTLRLPTINHWKNGVNT